MWAFIDDYVGPRIFNYQNLTFDMDELKLDQHFFTVSSQDPNLEVFAYTLHKDCVECPFLFIDKDRKNISETNLKWRIASQHYEYFVMFVTPIEGVICDLDPSFGQFGVYRINANKTDCWVDVLKEPVNIYSPVVTVFLIYLLMFGGFYGLLKLYRKIRRVDSTRKDDEKPKKERIMSVDTFRGVAIVIMIFANFGDGGYKFLRHTTWNGLHMADLVFPWFMWIMGVCIPISLSSSFKRNVPDRVLVSKALVRAVKLFCLGIFLTSGCDLYYLRIFGVLQRFALCYFIVTSVCIFTMKRTPVDATLKVKKHFEDVWKLAYGWIIVAAIVVLHTVLLFTVADVGCPTGYLGPGGLHKNRRHEKCIGGAVGYIDKLILGNHVYQHPTISDIYEAKPFDPEGVVGCLTSIFQVFLGVQAGVTLLVYKTHSERILRWLVWGIVSGVIGGILCGFSKDDGIIPVNKNLWSLSFVLVTSCFAFCLLTSCYVLVDLKRWWSGKPFLFAGMNAIVLYVGHEMTDGHFPIRWYFYSGTDGSWRRTHFVALLSDVWAAEIWVLIAYFLYKKKIFFSV